jgi:hypothetical protein
MHKLRCWTRVSALPQDGIQIARNSKSFSHLLRESNSGVERSLVFLSIDDRDRAARVLEGVSGATLLAGYRRFRQCWSSAWRIKFLMTAWRLMLNSFAARSNPSSMGT